MPLARLPVLDAGVKDKVVSAVGQPGVEAVPGGFGEAELIG